MSEAQRLTVAPVVLAGGSGTRLWPLSRAAHPKQFLSLGIGGGETLFQQAALRIVALAATGFDVRAPCIVANEEHRFTVVDQLRFPVITLTASDAMGATAATAGISRWIASAS